jgi:hypothetical protein
MVFDGGEMARYYWVICDHKMLNYCGIFPMLESAEIATMKKRK